MSGIYDFSVEDIDGNEQSMEQYRDQVLLIVNTASKCGFTPQYEGLQKLQSEYGDKNFTVLGFPCDQFRHQEPGDAEEIKKFCRLNYETSFPMFSKIEVNGSHTEPLYRFLKHTAPGLLGTERIKWNFTKFLVDAKGNVVKRFAPKDEPGSIRKDIERLL